MDQELLLVADQHRPSVADALQAPAGRWARTCAGPPVHGTSARTTGAAPPAGTASTTAADGTPMHHGPARWSGTSRSAAVVSGVTAG